MVGVQWYGADNLGEKFMSLVQQDEVVNQIMAQINGVVDGNASQIIHIIIPNLSVLTFYYNVLKLPF